MNTRGSGSRQACVQTLALPTLHHEMLANSVGCSVLAASKGGSTVVHVGHPSNIDVLGLAHSSALALV